MAGKQPRRWQAFTQSCPLRQQQQVHTQTVRKETHPSLHSTTFVMPMDPSPRRPRYLRNVFYLFVVLLTYIISLLLASRSSVPLREQTVSQRSDDADNELSSWSARGIDEKKLDTVESQQPHGNSLWKFPETEISLQPSPGVAWLMSFGGSVSVVVEHPGSFGVALPSPHMVFSLSWLDREHLIQLPM